MLCIKTLIQARIQRISQRLLECIDQLQAFYSYEIKLALSISWHLLSVSPVNYHFRRSLGFICLKLIKNLP